MCEKSARYSTSHSLFGPAPTGDTGGEFTPLLLQSGKSLCQPNRTQGALAVIQSMPVGHYPHRVDLSAISRKVAEPAVQQGRSEDTFTLHRGSCGGIRHSEKAESPPDMLTPVPRALGPASTGFPGENLFAPNDGAAGRTSAAIPFAYVLRCCAPQRAGDLVLRA